MRVLVAPDKFKGTLSAPEAAAAMARGWRAADPDAEVVELPVADGGDGTLDVLVSARGGRRERLTVRGPLGDPVEAEIALIPWVDGEMAVVEMAAASGLELVPAARRDPLRASTHGTGELILAAARSGARRILVCIGGSATTDGGAGVAQALGVRLLDEAGGDLPPGGGELRRLARVDATGLAPEMRAVQVVVASDVDNPLTGPHGAARVYGPQKGAGPEDVRALDDALRHCAAVVERDLAVDMGGLAGAGAAGGLGGGLVAFLGASIRPGFEVVAEALGLAEAVTGSDVVATGEGRWDEQSERGKAPAGVLRMASASRRRRVLIVGSIADGVVPRADVVESLAVRAGSTAAAIRRGAAVVEEAAASAARTLAPP